MSDIVITIGFMWTYLTSFVWVKFNNISHIALTDGTLQSERELSFIHKLCDGYFFVIALPFLALVMVH